MNASEHADWPQVDRETFTRIVDTFDYRREHFANLSIYRDRDSGRVFAEHDDKAQVFRVHPGLLEDEAK